IAAQIVSGSGFLGGGVILKEGANVRGLNTAATIWCASAVGTLAGSGQILYAAMVAAGVVAVNLIFRPLAYRLNPPQGSEAFYELEMTARLADEVRCRSLVLNAVAHDALLLR